MSIAKKVVGFYDYYVTNTGEVYSRQKRWKYIIKLKQKTGRNGYKYVDLRKNGQGYNMSVHRLVALAFIPNPENKLQINHKNGIKTDNRVENLEWVTASENIKHSFNVLGRESPKGVDCPTSKKILQIKNGKIIGVFYGVNDVERKLGLKGGTVGACCRGYIQTAYGYRWQYEK